MEEISYPKLLLDFLSIGRRSGRPLKTLLDV